jgi:hypothetical protein
MNEHQSQKQILNVRNNLRLGLSQPRAQEIDDKMFEQLRKISPEKLRPVLIQRNHDEWLGCFLIDELGTTKRFLAICNGDWSIQWAKKSSHVLDVPDPARDAFKKLMQAQEDTHKIRVALVEKIERRKCTSSKKDSTSRTPKKAAASST